MPSENMGVCPITLIMVGAVLAEHFIGTDRAQAGDGANTLGVAKHPGTDEPTAVDTLGIVTVVTGAAVTEGGLVQSDASGAAINKAAGVAVGRSLDAATLAGQRIRCVLIPN